jgi:hypothetical protein
MKVQRFTCTRTHAVIGAVLGGATVLLGGCASTTPTTETSVAYAIYDIKAGPEVTPGRVAEAVKVALQSNTSQVQIVNSIPPSPLPEKAPRFQLLSPFKGTNLEALAGASAQAYKVPTCEGAILTATAGATGMAKYGEATSFFACVMPYQGGYSLNIYARFNKASGAFTSATLVATLAQPLVGDSSKFIPRTIGAIVAGVKETGATVTLVEAFP